MSVWTEDRVGRLRDLYREGKTATQIAADLGGGITRNSVIGKIERLRLRSGSTVAAPVAQRPVPAVSKGLVPAVVVETMPAAAAPVTMDGLTEFSCRWPLGDPRSADFHFCGARKGSDAGPYCAGRAALARQTPAAYGADRRAEGRQPGVRR